MKPISGYKFIDEAAAQAAVGQCNEHYEIAPGNGKVTQSYVDYTHDDQGFYYIKAHESLVEVLGDPVQFEITSIQPII
jgi:hypothetical protein